ncbi:N-6 DNA methylase [bacterium]|nr:N-6 DNA methylase [bacterium]MBU1983941.1 N-6 DNA methylase [bacterium]
MSAPKIIHELIEAFRNDEPTYIRVDYSEARARAEFIDPFLRALGWHPGEDPKYIEEWKDCIVETSLEMENEAHRKRADYTCRIGKTPVLVIEAKKPQVALFESPQFAMQIRRYAYSLKLPVGVLTNFQQLAIYDGRIKPKPGDKPNVARMETLRYEEYVEKWNLIENLLNREAIQKGAQREHIQKRVAKGLIPVDQAILTEIERWRDELAKTMARKNKQLSEDDLDFAVGRTIDRILFLRVSEARGIEPEGKLLGLSKSAGIYGRLIRYYHEADERYNSGLFYFTEGEKGRAEKPDLLTLTLEIEDRPLKQIIEGLYYPQNLYEYSLIPVEILGQVYEQFLGKQIILKPRHVADVVDKPEVRKAGGVYYTPSYIVDYIVEHTVGKLALGKTPKQIEKLRIVDPACGSGSFLLGAYQYLLDWYLTWYKKDGPKKHQREVCPDLQEGFRLTLRERKRILLAHIYGVDIDAQAVEVTKLSLLLKVLEGETQDTVDSELKLRLRALPDPGRNIQCGNSLIGTDFYKDHGDLSDEERKKINPFDWKKAFPLVFRDGGFDAVIGNPPWGANLSESELQYLRDKHSEIIVRMIDSFMYFLHANSKRLRSLGFLGMIVPDVLLYQVDNEKLRRYILTGFSVRHSINMGNVFHRVTRPASIIVFQNEQPAGENTTVADLSSVDAKNKPAELGRVKFFSTISQDRFLQMPGAMLTAMSGTVFDLWDRIRLVPHQALGEVVDEHGIQRGVSPDLKDAFIVSPKTVREQRLEKEYLKPTLTGGKQVKRYAIEKSNLSLIYTDRDDDPREFPNIKKFVSGFKNRITCKEVIEGKHPIWSLHRARDEAIFTKKPKIIGVITGDRITVALDQDCYYVTDGLFLLGLEKSYDPSYIMAVLNSRLFVYLYRSLTAESGRVLAQVKPTLLKRLPIRTINFSDKADKTRHDKMVRLVERMLKLHKDAQAEWVGTKQEAIEREIRATDEAIDRLVYELYGLTEEEIRIVEGEK